MSEETRDFLDGFTDEPAVVSEADDTPAAETPEVTPETVEVPPAAPEAAAPAPTADAPHAEERVPLAALKAEREKRQERDRELQAERQARAELEKRLQTQAQPSPEIWADPDAFVRQRMQVVEQQSNQRLYAALEDQAKSTHPDYDDMLAVVQEHAQANPAISQQIFAAPNPAMAAYQLGKRISEFKQMEDPAAYREKIRAEARAEFEAEATAKAAERQKVAAALPPDLTAVRNVGDSAALASTNPVDELFPR